jgi:DUF4097 and DUF4098 domain-containing protein YvlB
MTWHLHRSRISGAVRAAAIAIPIAVALGACDVNIGNLSERATDEWTHTYPLSAGGDVRIANTNGRVEIEGVDGSTVEIHAERIAKGSTEAAARELLPRIVIKEDVAPDRVSVETEKLGGIMIGASSEVRFHVRAPRNAVFTITNTNGLISLKDVTGRVSAHTTNGGVRGTALSGGVDARTTNGGVVIDMASLGADKIYLGTVNGGVTLGLPESAKADVLATCVNGGINVSGLKLEISEQSRRRVEGKMNGGGTPIELSTVNGGVRLRPRNTGPQDANREP